ncbi:protocadherin Fat 1 [Crotalus adamanteus]|uniref:Protocadherin Fat 1 n=1 Tax=Crotalus adamanteus TaxID=8729 RepID=A0AAW1BB08_CROAD
MENSPKDISVIQIEAFDLDSSSNEKLTYKISSGNPQGFFHINPKTGLITTTSRKLDREQQAEHILEVTVIDNGIPAESTLTRVIVKILDENDNRPQFLQKFYQIKLPEREKPERERTARKEPIYRVVAADKDEGPNAEISYKIEDGNEHGKFFIDPITGVVSSKKYSGAGEYDILTIKAVDNGRPQKSSTARLHIEWISKPTPSSEPISFEESFFSFTVMESDPVAHMIGVIGIEPLGTPLWFDITGGNPDSRFDVDKGTGTMVVAKPLDAEQKSNYNLTVEATDGTRTISTQVYINVIDTNDHRPEFSLLEYQVVIAEDILPETEILQVSASDRDEKNKLTYTMQSSMDPTSLRKFRLDPVTGSLYTVEKLDHEVIHQHVLTIMVRDQDVPVKRNFARIIINVSDTNDHAPYFTSASYEGQVYESAAVGSMVVQVTALDKDKGENAEIIYSIESGNIRNAFNIDPVLGSIITAKELDLRIQDEYTLMVKATDKGIPPMNEVTAVHISVTISDNALPKFSSQEYSAEISENSSIGSFIIMLSSATVVKVYVADVNDSPPHFTAEIYKGTVSEDDPVGGVVAIISTTDADSEYSNRQVNYFITGGDPLDQFAVENIQNEWKVYVKKPLDREVKDNYLLNITATDGMFAAKAVVEVKVLDSNDNSPVCEKALYTDTVPEDSPPGKFIMQVMATDADIRSNAEITYTLYGAGAEEFRLSPDTGELKTLATLDREQKSVYFLMVKASDAGGRFCQSDIILNIEDINDNPPEFTAETYSITVFENTELNTLLTRVHATDSDAGLNQKIHYSLLTHVDGQFSIDELSGIVKLEKPLDRELQAIYHLILKAEDEGSPRKLSSTATLVVSVLDINDNPPVFEYKEYSATISENAIVGMEILQVYAASRDIEANAEITYSIVSGNEHGKFSIDSKTGGIFIIGSLDYEISPEHFLMVEATDGGTPSLSDLVTVNINITDINDNTPAFSQDTYTAVISEDAEVEQSVITILAADADGPLNNCIRYSIIDGNQGNPFTIDTTLGEIKVAKPLDREKISGYTLTVQASDNGYPPRSNTTTVNIDVSDINDNPPLFSKENYSIIIQENKPIGYNIQQLVVTDKDSSHNGPPFLFTILSGNELNAFKINQHAVLTTGIQLQRKVKDHYVLHIKVADSGRPQLSSMSYIDIKVIEESIHPPAILPLEIFITIFGEEYGGGVIGKVHATDQDVYDTLTYKLDPQMESLFSVSSTGGKLIAHKSTARLSFVTPHHHRSAVCLCKDGRCPLMNSICERNPCPEGTECLADLQEEKYTCVCDGSTATQCPVSAAQAVTFTGSSYVKYRLTENENKEEMKLTMRLRTYSTHAVVMYARGTDYSILEIHHGKLQYKFDCGSGPGIVSVQSIQISDGQWHSVSLEVDGNYAKLILDRVHTASGIAPGTLRTLNLDNHVFFGGHIRQQSMRHGRSPQVSNGFRGCMDSIILNGQELPLNNKPRSYAQMEESVDVSPGCLLATMEDCSSSPCQNGGICNPLPTGGYYCKCAAAFMGTHCEVNINPCASNPCLYGGTCISINDEFICQCRGLYTGQRCQIGPYCKDNPCKNSGKCIDSLDGPVCECETGFHGERCLTDVDECIENPCLNGALYSDSIQKPSWDFDYDTKVVDLDSCLPKKPLEEKESQPYSARESMSEVQSLSSFQSESCDDNESFAVPDLGNSRGYHWDTSDWMPNVQLPGIQEYPNYEVVEETAPLYTDPNSIDADYYAGGYDIESDFPPPPDDFPVPDDLPPLPPEYNDQFDSVQQSRDISAVGSLESSVRSRQRFNLNQYLPHHYPSDISESQNTINGIPTNFQETFAPYTVGYSRDPVENMSISAYASTASCSDMSACCEMESEVMMSDCESGDDSHFEDVIIPPLDPQQHTEV